MNPVKFIRTSVFKLRQAPFAADIAKVSQATVSRWEDDNIPGSQPSRDEMERIRTEAINRGLPWNDSWFFAPPAQQETAA